MRTTARISMLFPMALSLAQGCGGGGDSRGRDAATPDEATLDAATLDAAMPDAPGADISVAEAAPPGDAVLADGAPDAGSPTCTPPIDPEVVRVVRAAAQAILARQSADGAIFVGPTSLADNRLVPYFANLAARALCLATCAVGEASYAAAARRWLDWYAGHMNPDGSVYDYRWTGGALVSDNDFDSTDSYAATFIDTVRVCESVSAGTATRFASAVQDALRAVDLTYQADGLTFAKPSYRIKYLMDNVEVHRGLVSAAVLATVPAAAAALEAKAMRTLDAIETRLWQTAEGRYAFAMDEAGGLSSYRTGIWYPDVMAELMTVAWLPRSTRRDELFARMKMTALNIPAAIRNDQDGEITVWWGVAARTTADPDVLATVVARLTSLDFGLVTLRTPADYGHAISILVE